MISSLDSWGVVTLDNYN